MIEVEMSKDIREYKPKIFWILTKQQLKCYIIALTYGIPLFFFVLQDIEITARIMITFAAMAPVIAGGYCPAYGMDLDKFALMVIKNKLFTPQKRKYKAESAYHKAFRSLKTTEVNAGKEKYKKSKSYIAYK